MHYQTIESRSSCGIRGTNPSLLLIGAVTQHFGTSIPVTDGFKNMSIELLSRINRRPEIGPEIGPRAVMDVADGCGLALAELSVFGGAAIEMRVSLGGTWLS